MPLLQRFFSCIQLLHFAELLFPLPFPDFVTTCVGKSILPRNGACRAPCSSWVLRITEGLCELVVLSVGNERPFRRFGEIFPKLFYCCIQFFVLPSALPCFGVQ